MLKVHFKAGCVNKLMKWFHRLCKMDRAINNVCIILFNDCFQ